jgi:hypothetical protein
MEFDLFRIGITVIGIIIGSIVILLKRDRVKGSYKGPLYIIFLGLLLFLIMIIRIYSLNESVSISLMIDFLLFKKISVKGGADFYFRATGYFLIVIGLELFVLALLRRKKLKSNQ